MSFWCRTIPILLKPEIKGMNAETFRTSEIRSSLKNEAACSAETKTRTETKVRITIFIDQAVFRACFEIFGILSRYSFEPVVAKTLNKLVTIATVATTPKSSVVKRRANIMVERTPQSFTNQRDTYTQTELFKI